MFIFGYNSFKNSPEHNLKSFPNGHYCGYYNDGNDVELEKKNGKIWLNIEFSYTDTPHHNAFFDDLYNIINHIGEIKCVSISELHAEDILKMMILLNDFKIEHLSMSLYKEYLNEHLYENILPIMTYDIIKSFSCDIHTEIGIRILSKYLKNFTNLENFNMKTTLENHNNIEGLDKYNTYDDSMLNLFNSIKKLNNLKNIKLNIGKKCNLHKEYVETLKSLKNLNFITFKDRYIFDIVIPYNFDVDKIVCDYLDSWYEYSILLPDEMRDQIIENVHRVFGKNNKINPKVIVRLIKDGIITLVQRNFIIKKTNYKFKIFMASGVKIVYLRIFLYPNGKTTGKFMCHNKELDRYRTFEDYDIGVDDLIEIVEYNEDEDLGIVEKFLRALCNPP